MSLDKTVTATLYSNDVIPVKGVGALVVISTGRELHEKIHSQIGQIKVIFYTACFSVSM